MASLQSLREDALFALEELGAEHQDPADAESQIGLWHSYCGHLINAGYVSLLADADPKSFSLFLTRSGANWRILLQRARQGGFVVPAYRNQPLLGVMATDNVPLAGELAQLSARAREAPEYADEFLYAFFLQEVIASLAGAPLHKRALIQTVAELRQEADDARATLSQAILDGNAADFWSALEDRGRDHAAEMEERRKTGNYFTWRGARFVWLEGLALVRVAARLGFGAAPVTLPNLPPLALAASPALDDGAFLLAWA